MSALGRRSVLASAVATALARATVARAQVPTLQASYSTSPFTELMVRAAALYRERGGAQIQYRGPVAPSHDDHLQQTLRWAFMRELPDVSFQANNHVARLAREGLAQPLDALAAADRDWAAAR